MQSKSGKIIYDLLGKLIMFGLTVQIGMGICYIVRNIGYVQMFGETASNVAVSGSLSCSVYTGVLYPVVLLLIRAVSLTFNLPWFSFMCLIQLALAITAGYFLLSAFGRDRYKKIFYFWGSLVFATFPFVLQIHMSVLTDSFALSFLMLEIAFVRRVWGSRNMTASRAFSFDMGRICLFWMLAALSEWDFLIIGALPMVIVLIRGLTVLSKTDRKGIVFPVIIAVLFTVLTIGTYSLTSDRQNPASPAKSIEVSLFDRVAWKHVILRQDNEKYRLYEVTGSQALDEAMDHRESIKTVVEPMVETKLGKKEAKKFFLELAISAFKKNRDEVLHDAAIDFAGYVAPPFVVRQLLSGRKFISYTSRNYDIFKRNSPALSKYYLDYSLLWFGASMMIAGVLWILRLFEKIRDLRMKMDEPFSFGVGFGAVISAVVTAIALAVRNTFLGNGVYDYKQAGFSMVLLLMFVIFPALPRVDILGFDKFRPLKEIITEYEEENKNESSKDGE